MIATLKVIRKRDCCGRSFYEIPADSKYHSDERHPAMTGFWFDCECKSTMFLPISKVSDQEIGWFMERMWILGQINKIREIA